MVGGSRGETATELFKQEPLGLRHLLTAKLDRSSVGRGHMHYREETSLAPHIFHNETVIPNTWQGQTDCIVGPFSSQEVATYFSTWVVDGSDYPASTRKIFARGDSWYVAIDPYST